MFVVLLTFFSASLPRKPMRVILLRYIRFSCSARLSRAPGSEWARLPRPEAAFLGGPARGEPEPERCRRQRRERGTDLKQSRNGWPQPAEHETRTRCPAHRPGFDATIPEQRPLGIR